MAAATLPWLVKRGALALWPELARSLVGGGLVLAAAIPLAAARVTGAPAWLIAVTTLPVALALTGLAQLTAAAVRGEKPGRLRLDPVLALVIAGASSLAGFGLAAGGPAAVLGAAGSAGLLLVGPLALTYGAVRRRTGLAAVRGGFILAAFRPSWAVTLLALGVIGGFAIVASVGVLGLVVVPLLLAIACSLVTGMLDDIDGGLRSTSLRSTGLRSTGLHSTGLRSTGLRPVAPGGRTRRLDARTPP